MTLTPDQLNVHVVQSIKERLDLGHLYTITLEEDGHEASCRPEAAASVWRAVVDAIAEAGWNIVPRVALLAVMALPAVAAPPPGTDLSSSNHAWFERQHSVRGSLCCAESDGHVLPSDDWRTTGVAYDVARLVDKWGHVINITATPDPAGGYTLAGVAGPPPPDLWVEAIDGERPAP